LEYRSLAGRGTQVKLHIPEGIYAKSAVDRR